MQNYFELKVIVPENTSTEEVENFLVMNDIYNYFVTDPKLEQEIMNDMPWLIKDDLLTGNAFITICIEDEKEAKALFELVSQNYDVSIRSANDSEWKDNWKQFARIVRITDDLVIKPVWVEYEKNEKEKIIELDSGAAFGTGTHETTKLCGQLLYKYMKKGTSIKDSSVIDIGTGSGILAIIAGITGAKDIVATDIDPVAVETAKINLEKNNISADVRCGDLLSCISTEKFDIITANIIVDILLILIPDVKQFLKKDGVLILSGILEERVNEIVNCAEKYGFILKEKVSENDWVALTFK